MRILIIANARIKGGLSGGDNIYLNFEKYFPAKVEVSELMNIDFKPFWLCYGVKIFVGCIKAIFNFNKYDYVYSASDFLMDSLPAFILKLKGNKWVAGFYLYAPKEKKIYYYSQKLAYKIIKKFADVVCITNNSMKHGFEDKRTIAVNGGVDLNLAGEDERPRVYDAVFIGRIHFSKGIDELIKIWKKVRKKDNEATLAVIGDGDLGIEYMRERLDSDKFGVTYFGYMEKERFDVYKASKMVLYPATIDHFSMSPVEAMSCGCPMITFDLPVMKHINPQGAVYAKSINDFAYKIVNNINNYNNNMKKHVKLKRQAIKWANSWSWDKKSVSLYQEIKENLL